MALSTSRYELCFASSHTERECGQWGDPELDTRDHLKAAVLAITKQPPPKQRCHRSDVCSSCNWFREQNGRKVTECSGRRKTKRTSLINFPYCSCRNRQCGVFHKIKAQYRPLDPTEAKLCLRELIVSNSSCSDKLAQCWLHSFRCSAAKHLF